ncbi:MAG: hypothetical protein II882_09525 [Lachnospiraceae bacterium]|nr:hypothetical protein [Lachnospiraceae bacterium]
MENNREQKAGRLCFRDWLHDEEGVGVVEVILILVVLIALIVIFKDQLTALVNSIFSGISDSVESLAS